MGFNKRVLTKAVSELGKAKAPAKPKDIITDPAGQWKYPGQETRIPGNDITMQGVNYPVWAQPNVGPGVAMQPGQDYYFPNADYVDETPLAKKGGSLKSKKYSKSMSATNKLFAKNKLFKNMKSKIFDPNAKFKSGGSKLGPINLNPNPLSHYELNYGFNLPTKQDGGENEDEYMDLTDEEIQAYRDGGYIVEELPENEIGGYVQHELVKAQGGKEVYSGPKFGLQGPSSPKPKPKKVDTSPSVENAKKLEQFRKLQEQNRQQALAKQKENELMKRMPKTQVSDNTRTIIPKQAVSDIKNTAIINSPQYKAEQKAKKDAQAAFEKEQWKKYNKASTMEKIVDRTQAALSQPLLMASNALSGKQAYIPGMHEGLMNTESSDYDKWLSATGQTRGAGINDVFNIVNPGNWGGHAGNEVKKGNIASGVTELGLGLLGAKGLKNASGLVKGTANTFNKAESKLSKFIPERVPGTPSTGGGNLNAGISPELIKNAIGPKNKMLANIADNTYFNLLGNKTINKISPLNWVPGYGNKLQGAVKPLGNVLENSIKDGKLVESKSLIGKLRKSQPSTLTTKIGKTNASDIYSAKINGSVEGSNIGLGAQNQQGFIGKTFRKGNASYPLQTKAGTNLTEVPLTDAGVSLHRRLPFSNRYVPIDKEKLMNNKFQWATTGAGAQKLGERFGAGTLTGALGTGAYVGATYNPYDYIEDQDVADQMRIENVTPTDIPTRTEAILQGVTDSVQAPSDYLKENADPYFLRTAATTVNENLKEGGIIEEAWEDELDEDEIAILRKGGYIVEELD